MLLYAYPLEKEYLFIQLRCTCDPSLAEAEAEHTDIISTD